MSPVRLVRQDGWGERYRETVNNCAREDGVTEMWEGASSFLGVTKETYEEIERKLVAVRSWAWVQ